MMRGFEHFNGFEYPFALKFNWSIFLSRNGIIHITQLGKKVMAEGKRQKIIQNADTEAMFTVLLAGFAAHFKFTNRQVIYQNHLLQK